MNNLPLVSVIVTTYNRADLLSETLDSIINQTYKIFELIVVDDGSTDNTEEVVKKYNDSRLQYIKTDNWGGPARPRNIGIKQSKGKYIAFCDDDDIWLPQKLEKQIKCLDNSDTGMVFSMQKQFGITSIFSNYFGIGPLPFKKDTSTNALLQVNCIPTSTVIIKKDLLDQIGYFDERRSFIAIEDNDLWIRASKVATIGYIPEVLVLHRNHRNSIYENSDTIDQGMQELSNKHGFVNKKYSIYNYKNNRIYFLFRNLFLLIMENIFYKVKTNIDYSS